MAIDGSELRRPHSSSLLLLLLPFLFTVEGDPGDSRHVRVVVELARCQALQGLVVVLLALRLGLDANLNWMGVNTRGGGHDRPEPPGGDPTGEEADGGRGGEGERAQVSGVKRSIKKGVVCCIDYGCVSARCIIQLEQTHTRTHNTEKNITHIIPADIT